MSLPGSNEVIISSTTKELVEGSGQVLEDDAMHSLKGLAGDRQLFRLVVAWRLDHSVDPL